MTTTKEALEKALERLDETNSLLCALMLDLDTPAEKRTYGAAEIMADVEANRLAYVAIEAALNEGGDHDR